MGTLCSRGSWRRTRPASAVGDSLEVSDRLRLERAVDQLFHDDAIEFVALAEIGTQELQSARRQPLRVDFAVDELSCSRHPVENI